MRMKVNLAGPFRDMLASVTMLSGLGYLKYEIIWVLHCMFAGHPLCKYICTTLILTAFVTALMVLGLAYVIYGIILVLHYVCRTSAVQIYPHNSVIPTAFVAALI